MPLCVEGRFYLWAKLIQGVFYALCVLQDLPKCFHVAITAWLPGEEFFQELRHGTQLNVQNLACGTVALAERALFISWNLFRRSRLQVGAQPRGLSLTNFRKGSESRILSSFSWSLAGRQLPSVAPQQQVMQAKASANPSNKIADRRIDRANQFLRCKGSLSSCVSQERLETDRRGPEWDQRLLQIADLADLLVDRCGFLKFYSWEAVHRTITSILPNGGPSSSNSMLFEFRSSTSTLAFGFSGQATPVTSLSFSFTLAERTG